MSEELTLALHEARNNLYIAGLAIAALYRGDDSDQADLGAFLVAEDLHLRRQQATQQASPRPASRSRIR